jgi:hypothetical protein
VRAGSQPNQLWFFCNGSLAHDGREGTRRSSLGRGSGGPSSTSSSLPRNTNQWASPGASQKTRCSKAGGVPNGSSLMLVAMRRV